MEDDQTEAVLHCHIEISSGFGTAVFLFVSFMLFIHFWNVITFSFSQRFLLVIFNPLYTSNLASHQFFFSRSL